MTVNRERLRKHIQDFKFEDLFNELGWDYHTDSKTIVVEDTTYTLKTIAEKRGMVAFHCPTIPEYKIRRKIERLIAQSFRENILVYSDGAQQVWQWVKREAGKPLANRERTFTKGQHGENIVQVLDGIAFSLEEEENLTIVDVTSRVRASFDVERVTKRFYDRFKKEHDAFLKFIKGIPDSELQRWYASVMLNRLMFIYFVQRKGFLDSDENYLRNRLNKVQGNFHRDFLCPLFFDGFAQKERDPQIRALLGDVPYLNGGLFLKHQIEEQYGDAIQIENAAFEKLFEFFDGYHWHLDERPLRDDREINPDVLGYIFEKYINQRQMGAYYTKEDITEYISKNTILPYLFDQARKEVKISFEGEHTVWDLLREDPDRYIYDAVKHGIYEPDTPPNLPKHGEAFTETTSFDSPSLCSGKGSGDGVTIAPAGLRVRALPEDIAAGLHDISKRDKWNSPAPADYGLPTEIWREVVARRQRYEDIRGKITNGEICAINDLITYNLDIQQFAQDVIDNTDSSDLLRALWKAINNVTVLDPTCGSGAFLFAALNILEPLYEACLERMEGFIEEQKRTGKDNSHKYSDFRKVMERIDQHPNRRYFILKSIIVNNLFGVDIMEEAVEICKLRLFLKLVSQLDDKNRIEPLPDIDFNIRAGNTLVGFASRDEFYRAVTHTTTGQKRMLSADDEKAKQRIDEKAEDLARLTKRFREQQIELGGSVTAEDKTNLKHRLSELENGLNQYLARQYNADIGGSAVYDKWHDTHKPFHWFVQFYGVLNKSGFNVIIGNPPYVEYKKVRNEYKVIGFVTEPASDLYAFAMERSLQLLSRSGYLGMIVPVSIASTDGFESLRSLFAKERFMVWASHYAERPSKLFNGVDKRLTIWITSNQQDGVAKFWLSKYRRWFSEERENLFATMQYVEDIPSKRLVSSAMPKINSPIEQRILERLASNKILTRHFVPKSKFVVYYTRKLRYFVQFFDFIPKITDGNGITVPPTELKEILLASQPLRDVVIAILNSSLYFWFLTVHSDVRNINKREIEAFPCSLETLQPEIIAKLGNLTKSLMVDFNENSRVLTNDYGKHGILNIQSFQPRLSKPIIDEIDRVLAQHYGFTDEELDFILNYDIKYRVGASLSDEGEGEEE